MSRSTPSRGPSPGTISVCCLGSSQLCYGRGGSSVSARFDRYRYTSPADIAGSLAEFDRLTMHVYTTNDGIRRFVPREEEGPGVYIARAFQIGHSLLARDRGWSKAKFDDYLMGKLAYDWLCHARQRLKPRKLTAEELVTPGHLRRELLRRDALPDELSDTGDGRGGSERVTQIAAAGAKAAVARGLERPTETEILALGLMDAAAHRPPLNAQPAQVARLVREALVDFGENDEALSPEVWEEISEEFEAAVRDRLWISQEQFNDWLYGKRAYMLQTVEKGAALPPNVDRRDLTRRAMLEEAWRGFTLVSECLDAFAQTFERALTRPLNEMERRWFRNMYRRRPYYGDLVLPLLLDAKDLVEHAVLDLWENPNDPQAIDVFQRMLLYRSQIIPRVRETERLARAKKKVVLESSSPEEVFTSEESRWAELTGHILEKRGITCPDCDLPPICTLARANAQRLPVTLEVGCSTHGPLRSITITQAEFTAAHEALYGERG